MWMFILLLCYAIRDFDRVSLDFSIQTLDPRFMVEGDFSLQHTSKDSPHSNCFISYPKNNHKPLHDDLGPLHDEADGTLNFLNDILNDLDNVSLPELKIAATDYDVIEFKATTNFFDSTTEQFYKVMENTDYNISSRTRRQKRPNYTGAGKSNWFRIIQEIVAAAASFFAANEQDHPEFEQQKKYMVVSFLIQFVTHGRYECGKALRQRQKIRSDKRYKMGYLFNRLRRLKTEMLKIISIAETMYRHKGYRSLFTIMRMLEKVVRYDVDVRDTIDIIKTLFAQKEHYDTIATGKKRNKRD